MPSTPAVLALRAGKVDFTPHFYTYEEKGGTASPARSRLLLVDGAGFGVSAGVSRPVTLKCSAMDVVSLTR